MINQILTQEAIKELLYYDPETGVFTWLIRDARWFKTQGYADGWNARYSGTVAGALDDKGYRVICLLGQMCMAHRLAFLYMDGEFPPHETDHIKGIRRDNRWKSIRAVTCSENQKNKKTYKNNKSGCMGVHWSKSANKWQAQIQTEGDKIHLGSFAKLEDAVGARATAEVKYNFHPNHGRKLG